MAYNFLNKSDIGASNYLEQNTLDFDKLQFSMLHQSELNWCWAAVTASLSYYYDNYSTWTQCKVVQVSLNIPNTTNCCGPDSEGLTCNRQWYLDDALDIVGIYKNTINCPISFNEVQSEIRNFHPISIRVNLDYGYGHFLTILGWQIDEDGTEYYDVDDPIYGPKIILKDKLLNGYKGNGVWTTTYKTKQP